MPIITPCAGVYFLCCIISFIGVVMYYEYSGLSCEDLCSDECQDTFIHDGTACKFCISSNPDDDDFDSTSMSCFGENSDVYRSHFAIPATLVLVFITIPCYFICLFWPC